MAARRQQVHQFYTETSRQPCPICGKLLPTANLVTHADRCASMKFAHEDAHRPHFGPFVRRPVATSRTKRPRKEKTIMLKQNDNPNSLVVTFRHVEVNSIDTFLILSSLQVHDESESAEEDDALVNDDGRKAEAADVVVSSKVPAVKRLKKRRRSTPISKQRRSTSFAQAPDSSSKSTSSKYRGKSTISLDSQGRPIETTLLSGRWQKITSRAIDSIESMPELMELVLAADDRLKSLTESAYVFTKANGELDYARNEQWQETLADEEIRLRAFESRREAEIAAAARKEKQRQDRSQRQLKLKEREEEIKEIEDVEKPETSVEFEQEGNEEKLMFKKFKKPTKQRLPQPPPGINERRTINLSLPSPLPPRPPPIKAIKFPNQTFVSPPPTACNHKLSNSQTASQSASLPSTARQRRKRKRTAPALKVSILELLAARLKEEHNHVTTTGRGPKAGQSFLRLQGLASVAYQLGTDSDLKSLQEQAAATRSKSRFLPPLASMREEHHTAAAKTSSRYRKRGPNVSNDSKASKRRRAARTERFPFISRGADSRRPAPLPYQSSSLAESTTMVGQQQARHHYSITIPHTVLSAGRPRNNAENNKTLSLVQIGNYNNDVNSAKEYIHRMQSVHKMDAKRIASFAQYLQAYLDQKLSRAEVLRSIGELFKGYPDLIDDFGKFLPATRKTTNVSTTAVVSGEIGITNRSLSTSLTATTLRSFSNSQHTANLLGTLTNSLKSTAALQSAASDTTPTFGWVLPSVSLLVTLTNLKTLQTIAAGEQQSSAQVLLHKQQPIIDSSTIIDEVVSVGFSLRTFAVSETTAAPPEPSSSSSSSSCPPPPPAALSFVGGPITTMVTNHTTQDSAL